MNFILNCILMFLLLFKNSNGFPMKTENDGTNLNLTPPEIIKFMKRFGYLDNRPSFGLPDADTIYHESTISDAIKNIQKFGNLNESGILDNKTLELMNSPRCGVPDILPQMNINFTSSRFKRYVIGAQRWLKRNIKYFIANWSEKVSELKVIRDIKRVFNIWSYYSNLTFTQVYDNSADIIIGFGSQYHGDNFPFDGPGQILAHAFYPYEMLNFGGDIHFDNDENWKENATNLAEGVDFFTVALHELGHSLGLAHSPVYSSIMFPYYKGPGQARLGYDDIIAMYYLYIEGTFIDDYWTTDNPQTFKTTVCATPTTTRTSTSTTITEIPTIKTTSTTTTEIPTIKTTSTTTTKIPTIKTTLSTTKIPTIRTTSTTPITTATTIIRTKIPNICYGYFDAVSVLRGKNYIFRGDYVWKLTKYYKIAPGYPINIHKMFTFLPIFINKIDGAYERKKDKSIVIFTGKQYWVYDGHKLIEPSPRPISDFGLPQNLSNINAVMIWPPNQKLYLFGVSKYWRYDEISQKLDDDYPKTIKNQWFGIPDDINAAVTITNGKTYFFKHEKYWLFNNKLKKPEPNYPKIIGPYWLGCSLKDSIKNKPK